jgi:hypothetical protein
MQKSFFVLVSRKVAKIAKEVILSLTARSDYFDGMLNNEFVETKTNSVPIDDFEEETVETFVDFVYGKKIDDSQLTCDLLVLVKAILCNILRQFPIAIGNFLSILTIIIIYDCIIRDLLVKSNISFNFTV